MSRFMLRCLWMILAVSSLLSSVDFELYAASRQQGRRKATNWQYAPGRIIVKFKAGGKSLPNQAQALFSAHKVYAAQPLFESVKPRAAAISERVGLNRVFMLQVAESTDIERLAEAMRQNPAVEYAEPDYLVPATVVPNDTRFSQQQHLPQIKAPEAWDIVKGNSDVIVAIIDTGTDWNHPDLADNIWTNPNEIAGDGIDNDNNGFVDDIRGWDFVDNGTNVAAGEDGDNPDNDPMDFNGHGTHTAGLAGAVTDNGTGVAAISWNVSVMPLRIGWHTTSGTGVGFSSTMSQAFVYAADNGASVANLSFENSSPVLDGAYYAFLNDVVVVVSAGNGNSAPSSTLPNAFFTLSVAALDERDRKASYSSFGEVVKVAAPGGDQPGGRVGILSTVFDDSYASFSGTSMASPLTAGLAALVRSQHPDWTAAQTIFQVVETADNIDGLNPNFVGQLGTGRINALRAVTETVTPSPRITLGARAIDDSQGGNGNGIIEPGESINLIFTLQNVWGDAKNLTATLAGSDWAVSLVKTASSYGTLLGLNDLENNRKDNSADPFTVMISPEALPHRAFFTLELRADNGYQASYEVSFAIAPSVLLVDDDDGENNVENYYTDMMDELGIAYDVHEHLSAGTPSATLMSGYATVIWLCEWTFPALDSADRAELAAFLDGGGNLFLSGQDIGWDLCDQNHPGAENEFDRSGGASLTFYENYLHGVYLLDDSQFSRLTGAAGDPIGDGLTIDVNQPGRASTEQFPSELLAIAPAVSVFDYPNGSSGAVRFAGSHRVVNFAFGGYEAIAQEDQRKVVLPRVINWLNGLSIAHTPLRDTEDSTSARRVTAQVTSTVSPLATVDLYWDTDGAFPFKKVTMTGDGSGNYSADIPAQSNAVVEYFIFARNQQGFSSPLEKYSYASKADREPPAFANLTTLDHTIRNTGPFAVTVEVSDNLGVEAGSVIVNYSSSSGRTGSAKLNATSPGVYHGQFNAKFAYGDTVTYFVSANDVSAAKNRGESESKSFLVGFENFEIDLSAWSVEPGGWGLSNVRKFSGVYSANTNPGGTYNTNLNTSLTLALPLDLSDLSAASLRFYEQHYFASNQEDFGVVEISSDGGQNWVALSEEHRGQQNQWRQKQYSLAGYVGAGFNDVRLRFRIQTDANATPRQPGWFVDDVRILSNISVSVEAPAIAENLPAAFHLGQNYPNPFSRQARNSARPSAATTIRFELPQSAEVDIALFDLLGRRVATLFAGKKVAGAHTVKWAGIDDAGRDVTNGIYFYRLHALTIDGQEYQELRRMVVLE